MTEDFSRRVGQPTHEALWPTDLFTQGIGWVIIARFKSNEVRVQAGIFLVDVFCLGAKLAHYEDCDGDDYRRHIRNHYLSRFPMVVRSQPISGNGGHDNYGRGEKLSDPKVKEIGIERSEQLRSDEPRCARKLVEQAVQYAQSLGFAPHPDYKKAARVFGGLRAKQCSQKFTFGHEGKPFYRRDPRETEEQARRICVASAATLWLRKL